MKYELANELKDAGFPQGALQDDSRYFLDSDGTDVFIPTLEELIEACGENLYVLQRWGDGWRAVGVNSLPSYPRGEGSTPTEAVAKLWLALNLKKA